MIGDLASGKPPFEVEIPNAGEICTSGIYEPSFRSWKPPFYTPPRCGRELRSAREGWDGEVEKIDHGSLYLGQFIPVRPNGASVGA